jgi:tetratricopeptide (TPR) repeat protein
MHPKSPKDYRPVILAFFCLFLLPAMLSAAYGAASASGSQSNIGEAATGVIVLAIAVVVPAGIILLRLHKQRQGLEKQHAAAAALLEDGDVAAASALVTKFKPLVRNRNDLTKWTELELSISETTKDIGRMSDLFWDCPTWFVERETASLVVGRIHIETDQLEAFYALRKSWREREQQTRAWLALDADAMVREFRLSDARQLLEEPPDLDLDGARQVRLALLRVLENPDDPEASRIVADAIALEGQNPDVLSIAGKVAERQGRFKDSQACYHSAFSLAPGDPVIRDRYAEYCRRRLDFRSAIRIWQEGLPPPSMDFLWTKYLFWTRVTKPAAIDLKVLPVPGGILTPLIEFLMKLPRDEFWNLKAFHEFRNYHSYLLSRPEVFWLRVLEAIRTGREMPEALALLSLDPAGRSSWQPELEAVLIWTILYRRSGMLGLVGTPAELNKLKKMSNAYFEELRQVAVEEKEVAPSLHALLKSSCAFSAACFAAGWNEAGLRLLPKRLPPECPDWVFQRAKEALEHRNQNAQPKI